MACGSVGQSGVQPPSRVTRAIRMRVKRTIEEATKIMRLMEKEATEGKPVKRVEEVREAPAEFPSYESVVLPVPPCVLKAVIESKSVKVKQLPGGVPGVLVEIHILYHLGDEHKEFCAKATPQRRRRGRLQVECPNDVARRVDFGQGWREL